MRRALVFLLLCCAGPALAADHPDYTGTWTLDLAASDSVDPLMKAQGQSWIARRAARRMKVTQTLAQTEQSLTADLDSSLGHRHETLPIGGDWEVRTSDDGSSVKVRTAWVGDALVTETQLRLNDGSPAELGISRTLADGGRTMVQTLALRRGDQPTISARRVFRRR